MNGHIVRKVGGWIWLLIGLALALGVAWLLLRSLLTILVGVLALVVLTGVVASSGLDLGGATEDREDDEDDDDEDEEEDEDRDDSND